MARQAFELGGVSVRPGERTIVNIPLPGLYTETTVGMPVHVLHGRREGPTLFVSAAVHGDEINGIEIIRRIRHTRALDRLREEWRERDRLETFEALCGSLTGDEPPRSETAARLGVTEGAVKVAVHRLRQRYRELVERLALQLDGTAPEAGQQLTLFDRQGALAARLEWQLASLAIRFGLHCKCKSWQ